ncbi:hypothetical protein F5Y12DRAFT_795942 [Xylaria sp. FL1777]|nr:hypothetical protein F5Y12DRAFT_795942 [Xylaria sp. FL1777]
MIVRIEDLPRYHDFGCSAERYLFIGPDETWANFTTLDGRSLWRFSVVGSADKVDPAKLDMHGLLRKAFGRDDVEYELMQVNQWRRSQYTAAKFCEEGWEGPGLIKTYNTERPPVALRNGSSSTRNTSIWIDRQGRDKILDNGPEADEQRHALGEKMALNLRQEFQSLGLALGYNYAESPITISDGSSAPPDDPEIYIQTARPGHRVPHCWLGNGKSTIDLFGRSLVLLCLGKEEAGDQRVVDAASVAHIPLEFILVTEAEAMALYQRRLVLVRPDGMVAWRGNSSPDDVEALLDRVRGALMAVVK